MIEQIVTDAIILLLVFSLLPTSAIALLGGIVAVIQSAFQIQEGSISHLVKVIVLLGILWVAGVEAYYRLELLFQDAFSVVALISQRGSNTLQ